MVREVLRKLTGGGRTEPSYRCLDCGAAFDAPRAGFDKRRCPECGSAAIEAP